MTDGKNILVTGAGGQVGGELARLAAEWQSWRWQFCRRQQMDLTDNRAIRQTIEQARPDVIINCAAYTAVDRAETETELAERINHQAVEELCAAAKDVGAYVIHLSTDYVFDGNHCRPYRPGDKTNPQTSYGRSKRRGETAFLDSGAEGVIVRTSWVYSAPGKNFVATMLRLGREKESLNVVADQIGAPTWAQDLARALITIAERYKTAGTEERIYHYSNAGVCSWYDFAEAIMELSGLECRVSPIRSEQFPTPAKRPHFSVLDCQSAREDFQLQTPHWRQSLRRALAEFDG